LIIRNEDLPKIRNFKVEAIHNEDGYQTASNNLTFIEDKGEPYVCQLNHETSFKFDINVILIS
jgi:hypothetical protein